MFNLKCIFFFYEIPTLSSSGHVLGELVRQRRVIWGFQKKIQLNLNKVENNERLTNDVRSPVTNLKVLNLNGNKIHYLYSTVGFTN